MEHIFRIVIAVLALAIATLICLGLPRLVFGEEAAPTSALELTSTAKAILTLQPQAGTERAQDLARHIDDAAHENRLDPKLLVALIMRESSFAQNVELLNKLGSAGERGLTQVHPSNTMALSMRPDGCDANLAGARCQIFTGARYLAWCRRTCPGSTSRWVASYGMAQCPSEMLAPHYRTIRIAQGFYRRIAGHPWE